MIGLDKFKFITVSIKSSSFEIAFDRTKFKTSDPGLILFDVTLFDQVTRQKQMFKMMLNILTTAKPKMTQIKNSSMSELMELQANYSDLADFRLPNETTMEKVDQDKASSGWDGWKQLLLNRSKSQVAEKNHDPMGVKIVFLRNSTMMIVFNHTIIKPPFLNETSNETQHGKRQIEQQTIKIPILGLFHIELALFSSEAKEKLSFSVSLLSWEANRILLHFNFSDPLLISLDSISDKVTLVFNDPSLFVSNVTLQSLEPQELLVEKLPRMFPKSMDSISPELIATTATTMQMGASVSILVSLIA